MVLMCILWVVCMSLCIVLVDIIEFGFCVVVFRVTVFRIVIFDVLDVFKFFVDVCESKVFLIFLYIYCNVVFVINGECFVFIFLCLRIDMYCRTNVCAANCVFWRDKV